MKKYYIHRSGTFSGPFSMEELKSQEVDRYTYIWYSEIDKWTPARRLKELNEVFKIPELPLRLRIINFLHNSKIVFETIGVTALTVMAVIVAIEANNISKEQSKADYTPILNLSIKPKETSKGDSLVLSINNIGGVLTKFKIYHYSFLERIDKKSGNIIDSIPVSGCFNRKCKEYDSGKDLVFQVDVANIDSTINALNDKYKGRYSFSLSDFVMVQYVDNRNVQHTKYYEIINQEEVVELEKSPVPLKKIFEGRMAQKKVKASNIKENKTLAVPNIDITKLDSLIGKKLIAVNKEHLIGSDKRYRQNLPIISNPNFDSLSLLNLQRTFKTILSNDSGKVSIIIINNNLNNKPLKDSIDDRLKRIEGLTNRIETKQMIHDSIYMIIKQGDKLNLDLDIDGQDLLKNENIAKPHNLPKQKIY